MLKQLLGLNLVGLGLGASEKFWDPPNYFLQLLKLATSNLVHNLGSTSSMLKRTFRTKIDTGVG